MMKRRTTGIVMAAALALGAVQAEASATRPAGEGVQKPIATTVEANFEWATFLQRNDIMWDKLPQRFNHGAFHGNGLLGCMIYKDGPNLIPLIQRQSWCSCDFLRCIRKVSEFGKCEFCRAQGKK